MGSTVHMGQSEAADLGSAQLHILAFVRVQKAKKQSYERPLT